MRAIMCSAEYLVIWIFCGEKKKVLKKRASMNAERQVIEAGFLEWVR